MKELSLLEVLAAQLHWMAQAGEKSICLLCENLICEVFVMEKMSLFTIPACKSQGFSSAPDLSRKVVPVSL